MPYKSNSDLPDAVEHVLPTHAQDIYKAAFNSAWDEYKDKDHRKGDASREETAHKVRLSISIKRVKMINGIRKINLS